MSDDYSAKRISDTLCELRSIGDTVAYQLGDDNTESRAARIIEQLQRKLESAESRLDTRQRAATEAFALLQKHYGVADCVMPNDLDDLESAMKLLMGDSHAWETTAAGYCPKRYQARNAMIPACDCAHGICSNRLNDNYAGDVERCEPNPDYVPTIGPAYTPKT